MDFISKLLKKQGYIHKTELLNIVNKNIQTAKCCHKTLPDIDVDIAINFLEYTKEDITDLE